MDGVSASRRKLAGWTMGMVFSAMLWAMLIEGMMALRS